MLLLIGLSGPLRLLELNQKLRRSFILEKTLIIWIYILLGEKELQCCLQPKQTTSHLAGIEILEYY